MKFFYKKVNNLALLLCDALSGRTKPVLVLQEGFLMYEVLLACVLGGVMVCAAFGMIARMQHNAHVITCIDRMLCDVRRDVIYKECPSLLDDQERAVGIQIQTLPCRISDQAIASLSKAACVITGKKMVYTPACSASTMVAAWRDAAGSNHHTGFMQVCSAPKKQLLHGGGYHA